MQIIYIHYNHNSFIIQSLLVYLVLTDYELYKSFLYGCLHYQLNCNATFFMHMFISYFITKPCFFNMWYHFFYNWFIPYIRSTQSLTNSKYLEKLKLLVYKQRYIILTP